MSGENPDRHAVVDAALKDARQGDVIIDADLFMVHLAAEANPITPASEALAESGGDTILQVASEVKGFAVLTQTCDIVRNCADRPYVELAPLQEVADDELLNIKRCQRPNYAYLPLFADRKLVVDLDRVITIEKSLLILFPREHGLSSDADIVAFQSALARKRQRFAFPDDFNKAMSKFQKRIKDRAGKASEEGSHVDALAQIRVTASPSWEAETVLITIHLIRDRDPTPQKWLHYLKEWESLIDQSSRFRLDGPPRLVFLEDMRASDYVSSVQLDLDHLSGTSDL